MSAGDSGYIGQLPEEGARVRVGVGVVLVMGVCIETMMKAAFVPMYKEGMEEKLSRSLT